MELSNGKLDLKLALFGVNEKLSEEKVEAISKKIEAYNSTIEGSSDLEKISAFHKLTVDQLINCSNYEILKKEFAESAGKSFLKILASEGFTNAEAEAILASSVGLLD